MSDPGHAAGGGRHLANTSKVIDKRAARAPDSSRDARRGRAGCAAALATRRGPLAITSSTSGKL